jgi:predicted oxidoreductase
MDVWSTLPGCPGARRDAGAVGAGWVLGAPRVTCPIVGARNLEQLNDTWVGEIKLTPESAAAIPACRLGDGWAWTRCTTESARA